MRNVAENYFHGVEKYNCSQAILKTFQENYDVAEETILEHKQFGGGRAEENTCGALYAAKFLEKSPEKQQEITDAFVAQSGSPRCREIRTSKTLSCRECVGVTAEILEGLNSNN